MLTLGGLELRQLTSDGLWLLQKGGSEIGDLRRRIKVGGAAVENVLGGKKMNKHM